MYHQLDNTQTKDKLDLALLEEAALGSLPGVQFCIKYKADVNVTNQSYQTPLVLSMLNNHKDVAEYLVVNGADYQHDGLTIGKMPIFSMAKAANIEMLNWAIDLISRSNETLLLKQLTQAKEEIKSEKSEQHDRIREILTDNILNLFIKLNQPTQLIQLLSNHKMYLNKQDALGQTLLHKACSLSNFDCVKALLKEGAQYDIKDNNGKIAVELADGKNKQEIVHYIKHHEVLEHIKKTDLEVLKKLMPSYLKVEKPQQPQVDNLLFEALRLPNSEVQLSILNLLLTHNEDVNNSLENDKPLHHVVSLDRNGNYKKHISMMIKAGALENNLDLSNKTVVDFARSINKADIADFMLKKFEARRVKQKHGLWKGLSNSFFSNEAEKTENLNQEDHKPRKLMIFPQY